MLLLQHMRKLTVLVLDVLSDNFDLVVNICAISQATTTKPQLAPKP